MCPAALRAYAQTCKEGSIKYGDRNWEKGIPTSNYIDHAMEHLVEAMREFRSGPTLTGQVSRYVNLSHALWNIAAAIHNEERCTHHVWED